MKDGATGWRRQLVVRPFFRLLFNCFVATVSALIAAFILVLMLGPQMSGLSDYGITAAQFIRERNHFFLVRPEWIAGAMSPNEEFDAMWRWMMAESKARLALVLVAWIVAMSLLIRGYSKRRPKTRAAGGHFETLLLFF